MITLKKEPTGKDFLYITRGSDFFFFFKSLVLFYRFMYNGRILFFTTKFTIIDVTYYYLL